MGWTSGASKDRRTIHKIIIRWYVLVTRCMGICFPISMGHLDQIHPWWEFLSWIRSDQISRSVVSDFCDPMNCSTPGFPVHHQLPEFTQTHIHRVGDAIQSSHPLSSPSPPAPNPSQHQSLFQWVNSSHEVAKVLEFQL